MCYIAIGNCYRFQIILSDLCQSFSILGSYYINLQQLLMQMDSDDQMVQLWSVSLLHGFYIRDPQMTTCCSNQACHLFGTNDVLLEHNHFSLFTFCLLLLSWYSCRAE